MTGKKGKTDQSQDKVWNLLSHPSRPQRQLSRNVWAWVEWYGCRRGYWGKVRWFWRMLWLTRYLAWRWEERIRWLPFLLRVEFRRDGQLELDLELAVDSGRQFGFKLCKYHWNFAPPFSYINLLEFSNLARSLIHPNAETFIGKTSNRTIAK